MIWIYIVPTDGIICSRRLTKYAFREYLISQGFSVESYDNESNHCSLIIKEESRENDLPYHYGDIIYFFSGSEFSKIHIDRKEYRYVYRNEFLAWQRCNKKGTTMKFKDLNIGDKFYYNGIEWRKIDESYKGNATTISGWRICHVSPEEDVTLTKPTMKFKELDVGDIFRINNGDIRKYIKISTISDDCMYYNRTKDHPVNMFILDNEHYGSLSPNADVTLIKKYPKTESPSYFQQNGEYDIRIAENQIDRWVSNPDTAVQYTVHDAYITKKLLDMTCVTVPDIKEVIFNKPATIVIWVDGSKTVVKCQDGEGFDKEKGLALCYMKKALGNRGNFNNIFREWIKSDSNYFYDAKHPELGIQESVNGRKILPAGRLRITELKLLSKYMHNNGLTAEYIAQDSGLSVKTVKRALKGFPIIPDTARKIRGYFDFPIKTTRYAGD